MMKNRTLRTLQAFVLAGLGGYLLERFWSGRLILYIHQRFTWLILLSAFALIGLAINTFNHRPAVWTQDEAFLIQDFAQPHAKLELIILVIPLILGILIPASSLGASAASSRSINQNAPISARGSNTLSFSQDSEDRSILEWLWAFEEMSQPEEIIGDKVNVEGFIFITETGSSEQTIMVGRFLITCCVADAIPVGIALIPPEGQNLPDGWVRVQGTMTIKTVDGRETLFIEADRLLPIEAPNNPYLYP
jgi:putative membrane protein